MMLTTDQYKKAEFEYTLAEAQRGFKIHAVVYGLVMTGLIVLNLELAPGARAHIPVDQRAPLAAFADVAAQYPVFRIDSKTRPLYGSSISTSRRTTDDEV